MLFQRSEHFFHACIDQKTKIKNMLRQRSEHFFTDIYIYVQVKATKLHPINIYPYKTEKLKWKMTFSLKPFLTEPRKFRQADH